MTDPSGATRHPGELASRATRQHSRFLGAPAVDEVWPYFGGPYVETGRRRLRMRADAAPGFWLMRVTGRDAVPVEPADPPDLTDRPAVRGFAVRAYLVSAGGAAARLALGPADEPMPFAPMVARRWHSGELIFEGLDFESGVEDAVRAAFEERRALGGVRGVPAPLRAAFAYAVLLRAADETGVRATPAEARAAVRDIADHGDTAARQLLERLRYQRVAAELRPAAPSPAQRWSAGTHEIPGRHDDDAVARAAAALDRTGAVLRHVRLLGAGQLEVRYDFLGERFVSIVDASTLQVHDAGICLDGADRLVTLESLPGVIREAVEDGALNITAW